MKNIILLIITILMMPSLSMAKGNLPLPRFVAIKPNEANIRTGPNVRYPIVWVFVKKFEPVELIAEFEHWRKIRDKQGDEGWIHETMLSGKRMSIVIGDKPRNVYNKPSDNSAVVFIVEPDVRAAVDACKGEWCQIHAENYKGWLEKKYLWGVYPKEEFK